MNNKQGFLLPLLVFFAIVAAFAGAGIFFQQKTTGLWKDGAARVPAQQKKTSTALNKMTFRVSVPHTTPKDDMVCMYVLQKGQKMKKVAPNVHEITLGPEVLGANENSREIHYRYSRNCANFWTAEYLEPDTNDYFWTKHGRTALFERGRVQHDTIARWRWFPPSGTLIARTSSLAPQSVFAPRVNEEEFRSAQILEDLYIEGFRDHFASTAKHMREMGYRWVEIDPPWQWMQEDGLPKVVNLAGEAPNYPDDETLMEEIAAFKAQGLKVMLGPQICCTEMSTEYRSNDWWDAYFAETTRFLVHFAQIAERAGVDAMQYAVGKDYRGEDYAERWSAVFQEVRKHFSGELGEMVWNFGSDPGAIIPNADYIQWGEQVDFFYAAIDTPISKKDDPSEAELYQGAATMLDGVKQLYDRYGKPIFVRTAYFNVKKTWKGNLFYDISSVPWFGDSEQKLKDSIYEAGPEDLARVLQAYFSAIAERPWVIGFAQFGYAHWEYPLSADLSVRGKPAEDLWKKWNNSIFK